MQLRRRSEINGSICHDILHCIWYLTVFVNDVKRYHSRYYNMSGCLLFTIDHYPCQYGGGYCFALSLGYLGHFCHSGHLRHSVRSDYNILPYISVAINVRLLKLKTCLIHKNFISAKSLLFF